MFSCAQFNTKNSVNSDNTLYPKRLDQKLWITFLKIEQDESILSSTQRGRKVLFEKSSTSSLAFFNLTFDYVFKKWAEFLAKIVNEKEKLSNKDIYSIEKESIYFFSKGWHIKGVYCLFLGFIFSASTIWNFNLMFLKSYSWIIGAFISSLTYYLLAKK